MSIELIDKIKPKNGGSFPLVDAEDVLMPDGRRMDDYWRAPDSFLDEQTVSGFVDGGTWWGYSAEGVYPLLVAGETYRVQWDGKGYVCVAEESDGVTYIGDRDIAFDEGSGKYPFVIRTTPASRSGRGMDQFACLTTDPGESHKIEIYRGAENKAQGAYPVTGGVAELQPEKYYTFGKVSTLAVTLVEADDGLAHEYCFEFIPTADFQGLSITPEVKWACDPQYPAGKTCQVSILRGVAVMACA